ncbi:MAG: hypothetical protein H7249_09825 [Chitinophagaceae bacterium]|nr:hypothetical protein [Oligoflexus sp.]
MVATVNQGNGNRVVLRASNIWTMYMGHWTVGGDCASNCALRPIYDDGQNLNAFGNGPYAPGNAVGTWGWNGGALNETWYLSLRP